MSREDALGTCGAGVPENRDIRKSCTAEQLEIAKRYAYRMRWSNNAVTRINFVKLGTGLETMAITSKKAGKLRVAQRTMERVMPGISLRDRVRIEEIRRLTGVEDVVERIARAKRQRAGHVARGDGKKWTNKLMQWKPRTSRRSAGKP